MTKRLDFGPEMLALFLQAHVLHAGMMAATLPFEDRHADDDRARGERECILAIGGRAALKGEVVLRAMRTDLRLTQAQRAALWRALDIDPDIHEKERP